jgi:hypothetical protein
MATITINDVSIKEYVEANETKVRKLWENGDLTSAQVCDLLKKINRVANAERELRVQLDIFDSQLDDALSDDEFI